MIHNERVRHMVKLQAFEDRKGKEYFPVLKYFRRDFVGLHLIRGFLSGTIAYGVCLLMWGLYYMEELMENIHTMDLAKFAVDILRSLRFISSGCLSMHKINTPVQEKSLRHIIVI